MICRWHGLSSSFLSRQMHVWEVGEMNYFHHKLQDQDSVFVNLMKLEKQINRVKRRLDEAKSIEQELVARKLKSQQRRASY